MLSAFTDKSSVSSTTATTPGTTGTASSLVMDEKALKAVDLNRQLSVQNVADIHERICRELPVPAAFVEKLVAFHLGQLTLTVDNLTQFFLFLESRFRRFANSLHAFQNLGDEDREILLTANAPYYFQLYLARYINAYDGLSQVRALLGRDLPSDLCDCDQFLTVSFRYFAAATRLFVDKTAMELYEDRANNLSNVTSLDDDRKLGHLAACLVFYKETGSGHGTFDSPVEISRAYERSLVSAAANFEAKTHWSSLTNLVHCVTKLKHLVHFYSSQANIRESVSTIDNILDATDNLFEDDIILDTYTDGITLTSLPHPETAREEERFWMCRHLAVCDGKMKEEVNLGDDYLHEAAMLFLLHEDAPLSNKFFTAAFKSCVRRAHLLLQSHHEFNDLVSSDSPNVAVFRQQLESNVTSAAAFAFCVVFDEMSTSKVYQGLARLMGDNDQQLWNDQYAMLAPNDSTQHMISVDRQTNLSFLGLPSGMLHTYLSLVTRLRESLGDLTSDLVNLIQLSILWKLPSNNFTNLSSRDEQPCINQARGLSERYLFHLTEKLNQSQISAALTQQLILAMPYQSFVDSSCLLA